MSHCPQCGTKAESGAEVCAVCGSPLAIAPRRHGAAAPALRTMVGIAAADLLPKAAQAPQSPPEAAPPGLGHVQPALRTMVGMPAPVLGSAPAPAPAPAGNLLGVTASDEAVTVPRLTNKGTLVMEPPPPERTLLGVARPGIAPSTPGAPLEEDELPTVVNPPREHERERELGATYGPDELEMPEAPAPAQRSPGREKLARRRVVLPPIGGRQGRGAAGKRSGLRRVLPVLVAAGACAVFAVLFAVFWRSAPPLTARVRADAEGREAVEIECASCPEGTKVQVGTASATVKNHLALVPLAVPLVLGENRLKVALDRPGSGRDETIALGVQVSYRLRPDLTALTGDKPTVQVVVEGTSGTEIKVEGQPVAIKDGPAVHAIDVSADCTGAADEPVTLKRRIHYQVTTPEGGLEQGAVEVAVGIVPLRIDAPGPRVVIDGETFVLAGRTMKGAEVLAAGRPIPVSADGTFAQRMSVSSVGSTAIEVRAKAQGMAPRIVPIAVRRVEKLEVAAREMLEGKPLGYAEIARGDKALEGKPVVVSGEVVRIEGKNHQSQILLAVPPAQGCPQKDGKCQVYLVHGFDNPAKPGDMISAYGQFQGLGAPAAGQAPLPLVTVAFTLPGVRPPAGGTR